MGVSVVPRVPTRLYSLDPLGIGTSKVESLISYILKLAEAHCVYPGELFKSELLPALQESYGINQHFERHTFLAFTDKLQTIISTLETLTGQKDLKYLTVLPFIGIFNRRGLYKQHKAWCPICFLEQGEICFEPLVWGINGVTVCEDHLVLLQTKCPRCHKEIPHITWNQRIGFCPHCRGFLGEQSRSERSDDEMAIWIARSIGLLLAETPNLAGSSQPRPVDVIKSLIEHKFGGNITGFAKRLGYKSMSTLKGWLQGRSEVSLEHMIRISHQLNIGLVDFINGNFMLHEVELRPVTQIISGPSVKKHDFIQIQLSMEAHLANDQPLPLKEIAAGLGISYTTLYKSFPDLSRRLTAKYMDFKHVKRTAHDNELRMTIKKIMCDLWNDGIYPSKYQVKRFLPPGSMIPRFAREAWDEAIAEIQEQKKINFAENSPQITPK
jgi:transcriptional regulator with XRE-family HTH domain